MLFCVNITLIIFYAKALVALLDFIIPLQLWTDTAANGLRPTFEPVTAMRTFPSEI